MLDFNKDEKILVTELQAMVIKTILESALFPTDQRKTLNMEEIVQEFNDYALTPMLQDMTFKSDDGGYYVQSKTQTVLCVINILKDSVHVICQNPYDPIYIQHGLLEAIKKIMFKE